MGELVVGPWELDPEHGPGADPGAGDGAVEGGEAVSDLDGGGLADRILHLSPVEPGGPLLTGTVFGPLLMDAAFPDEDRAWWLPPEQDLS
ncbi:MAG: hypothetical protein OJJ54_04900 [Pseudonocardia sp.]|nr:hypothetical protein [Pseudonocardia sp.]